jgi:hypothetical protein
MFILFPWKENVLGEFIVYFIYLNASGFLFDFLGPGKCRILCFLTCILYSPRRFRSPSEMSERDEISKNSPQEMIFSI